NVNPNFEFATAAGRIIVLSFLGPTGTAFAEALHKAFLAEAGLFSHPDRYLFAVALGAREADAALAERRPGMDTFWHDGKVSRLYGALPADENDASFAPVSYVLGIDLRVLASVRHTDPAEHVRTILGTLRRIPALGEPRLGQVQAPVLMLPD